MIIDNPMSPFMKQTPHRVREPGIIPVSAVLVIRVTLLPSETKTLSPVDEIAVSNSYVPASYIQRGV